MAYYPQPCDSYFVESQDRYQQRLRDERRESARLEKQQRQIAIAEELSQKVSNEYRHDVLQHMEMMENETLPDVASIDIQTEIQWYMRPYLLDFLIEAHSAFSLLPDTLFLTINLLDRYCSKRVVYKKHYQLVGCSALLIAAKYGDRKDRVPTIKELKTMCCALYEDDMFIQMEWHVLQTLNWIIGHPTVHSFLDFAVEKEEYDPEVEHMACYISEIAMYHKDFVGKRPSDMARSSLALARCILCRPHSSSTEWASKYELQTLVALSQQLDRPSPVLSRKYSTSVCSQVAFILEEFLARQASINKCYSAPPTPPAETYHDNFGKNFPGAPATPVKQQYISNINNGCPTPPITPTNQQYFAGPSADTGACQLPPTPTSRCMQQYNTNFTLPPINHIAPPIF